MEFHSQSTHQSEHQKTPQSTHQRSAQSHHHELIINHITRLIRHFTTLVLFAAAANRTSSCGFFHRCWEHSNKKCCHLDKVLVHKLA